MTVPMFLRKYHDVQKIQVTVIRQIFVLFPFIVEEEDKTVKTLTRKAKRM